jgi:predicted transcriptional regulator
LQPSGAITRTTSPIPFEFGNVVLVPFPVTSQRASGRITPDTASAVAAGVDLISAG